MGAVNYGTSDYITLGICPYDVRDFEEDAEFMKEIRAEVETYGGTVEEAIESYISGLYESDRANVEAAREKYDFWYFHVAVEPGYYEGHYIDIEFNFAVCLDTWEDRRLAQKEITQIRRFLQECAGVGFVACSPGWCTGYADYNETLRRIDAAVREMREEVRRTPTAAQYERGAALA